MPYGTRGRRSGIGGRLPPSPCPLPAQVNVRQTADLLPQRGMRCGEGGTPSPHFAVDLLSAVAADFDQWNRYYLYLHDTYSKNWNSRPPSASCLAALADGGRESGEGCALPLTPSCTGRRSTDCRSLAAAGDEVRRRGNAFSAFRCRSAVGCCCRSRSMEQILSISSRHLFQK